MVQPSFARWMRMGALFVLMHSAVRSVASSSETDPMTMDTAMTTMDTTIRVETQTTTIEKAVASENHYRRRRIRSGTECTLYMRETHYTNNPGAPYSENKEETWMCEVPMDESQEDAESSPRGGTNKRLRSSSTPVTRTKGAAPSTTPIENTAITTPQRMMLVEIEGLDEDFFAAHGAKSGLTNMKISEGYLEGNDDDDYQEEDEPRDVNSNSNVFVWMRSGSSKERSIDRSENNRIRPTILTKMVISPEAVVEVVDAFPGDEESSDEEEIENEAHSNNNIFIRGSLTRQLQERRLQQNNKSKGIGEITTLVIRVIAKNGIEPTHDIEATQNNTYYDPVCLKSQYAACSKNQLVIKPFEGTTTTGVNIEKGVVNVKVDINPTGATSRNGKLEGKRENNKKEFASRASAMAEEQLGNLPDQFDLVLFCIPPGTGDDWEAFANVNRWDSYYNDEWCGYVSAQLHEVGHNLNLAHSGEGDRSVDDNEYEDRSGIMGSSYQNKDTPKMCFNGAKNYQLRWYIRQQKSFDPTRGKPAIMTKTSKTQNFVMNGVVDYKVEGDTQQKLVSLRLKSKGTKLNYYIGYNRAFGDNEGTREDENEIIVWEKPEGGPNGFGKSWKLTALRHKGQVYVIPDFGLKKDFVEIKLLSDTTEGGFKNSKQDALISVTSYKAADPCRYPPVPFELTGKTDDYAYEISWSLKVDSPSGGYVDFGSGYQKNSAFGSTKNLCPGECYVFEINDLFGDGLGTGGFFKGLLEGIEVFSGSSFKERDEKRFCIPPIDNIGIIGDNAGKCLDIPTLKYDKREERDCSWVGRRISKRCKKIWEDKPLSEFCPLTCKVCS